MRQLLKPPLPVVYETTSFEPSLRLKIRVKKPIRTFQCFKKPMNHASPRAVAHKSLTFKKWTVSWE